MLFLKRLQEYKAENRFISTELQENIAQILAPTRFYLEEAEEISASNIIVIRKRTKSVTSLVMQKRAYQNLSHLRFLMKWN